MKGYKLFLERLNKLDYYNKHRVIGTIFNVDVLVCDLGEIDGKIYVKIYDGKIYYQICFVLDKDSEEYMVVEGRDRIILCKVFVKSTLFKHNNNEIILKKAFYEFLKILDEGDISYFDSFL